MNDSAHPRLGRIVWTRGPGCRDLAGLLAGEHEQRVEGDLTRACIRATADALVARRLTSFELVPTIVPHGFEVGRTASVTAAVAGGPHSVLAARVAAVLSERLGVPGELATVYRSAAEETEAVERLDLLGLHAPSLERRAVEDSSATGLVGALSEDALLVVGAAGGSWLQRQLLGAGHRLLVKAPGGTIVVRDAPSRAFQRAVDAAGLVIGRQMTAGAASSLVRHAAVPVAEGGLLVGILRAAALEGAPANTPVDQLIEPAVAIEATEAAVEADEVRDFLDGAPVPVVDRRNRLIGVIH